jgi:hypothetical protein
MLSQKNQLCFYTKVRLKMKKFNFILFAGALLSLSAFQLQSAEPVQAEKAKEVVAAEVVQKKQTNEQAPVVEKKAEAATKETATTTLEKKCECGKKAATPAQKK